MKIWKDENPNVHSFLDDEFLESSINKAEEIIKRSKVFVAENEDKIAALLDVFGNKTAESLELYATVVWVDRSLHGDQNKGHTDIAPLVHELKPNFEMEKVQESIKFMSNLGLLLSAAS